MESDTLKASPEILDSSSQFRCLEASQELPAMQTLERTSNSAKKMADLPISRLACDSPPFTCVGTDYFGPVEVKRVRSLVKRYGVLFTCLASRAIHLEMAYSLDTDSCILALRRFICRRGQVQEMISDNGTNYVGAKRELRDCLAQLDNS